jgi:hypothetical protein
MLSAVGVALFHSMDRRADWNIDYTEIGIGIKQDMEGAKRWYMRAAGASPPGLPGVRKLTIESTAQQHKRGMQRLTELNNAKNAKSRKAQARPTRHEAQSECVVM